MEMSLKLVGENGVPASLSPPQMEYEPGLYEHHQPLIDLMAEEAKTLQVSGVPGEKRTALFFDRASETCAAIKAGATSWRALDIIYNFTGDENDPLADFWVNMRNAQAVRNRLKISKMLIRGGLLRRRELTGRGTKRNPLQLVSLAAGSAQGVIEEVARLKWEDGIVVKVCLIDSDPAAESVVMEKAELHKVIDLITFIPERADRFDKFIKSEIDMIEMLGLLDYLATPIAVRLCKKIRKHLPEFGYFLTCHIHENPEMEFLRYVIDWGIKPHMYYRSKKELSEIMGSAGFPTTSLYTEPHGIHSIAVGVK